MKKLFFIITILLISVFIFYLSFERYSWNQKLTVEINTPNGVVSGSNVTRVRLEENDSFSSVHGPDWFKYISGEAVVIDLQNGFFVFALLESAESQAYLQSIALRKLAKQTGIVPMSERVKTVKEALGQPITLSAGEAPLLVTFDNINDPATVKEVNPNNLAASFGRGYSIKSIMLEITDEEVTRGELEKVLNWLDNWTILTPIWDTISSNQQHLLSSLSWRRGS